MFTPEPLTQPDLRPISDREYRLHSDYEYVWREGLARHRLFIPAGFVNDGASVPRAIWWLIRPDGLIRAAALVHDYLYRYSGDLPVGAYTVDEMPMMGSARVFTRQEADDLFYQIMREAEVSAWKAWIAHKGVRLGGWRAWG